MKLIGRKITREVKPAAEALALAIINPVNGGIRLSKKVLESCELEGKTISVACAEKEGDPTYIYVTPNEKDGFKVSKGAVSSRMITRELAETFGIEKTVKFSVEVSTEPTEIAEYPELTFFKLTFKETLGVVTAETKEPELTEVED